ncbi:FHA domain-containing protein [Myxococcota bacterium]|nr:FHA domain-containing protein [Myxococcota bacterium]
MLRKDLPPLDSYLADAMSLDPSEFLARYHWPMLVIPEPNPAVMAKITRPETVIRDDPTLMASSDPTSPRMSGASLDALCLEVRPKPGSSADRITLGRSPEADVVLIDETISRIHAELAWDRERERAMLTDHGGRNGTQVDGLRLPEHGRTVLVPGAVVAFGALVTRYYSPRAFLAWLSTGAPRAGASPGVWPSPKP